MPSTPKPFAHLHVHTCYSLLDGACRIKPLIRAVCEQNMPAVALTDHGVLYGAVDFYKAARADGIKPLIGCETYVATGSHRDRKSDGHRAAHHHLVLLAADATGYHNLMQLVTAAHLDGFYYKPRIDKELLAKHARGLIGLSACLKGEIGSHLEADNVEAALLAAGGYADILGKENFYLEMMDHGLPEQRKVNRHLLELSARSGLPLVATNDVHYLKKEHAEAHEVLLCLQTQTVMSDPKRMRYRSQDFYLKSRAEMDRLFAECPEAVERTLEVAERCNVEMEFGALHFPTFGAPDGLTQKEYLIRLAHDGIRRLYGIGNPAAPRDDREREVMRRFDRELEVIEKTGFVNYFLVVWDFVHFAHENHIPVGPGRGSGAGSLIAFALGITAIDPLRYRLIFERFLNPERVSPPDFDIDFCQTRRGEVIEYVKRKYGRDHVAQIITFGSLGAKTVIRDVGRALEIPYADCDRLSKMVPDDPKISLEKALEQNPDFRRAYENEPDCKRILEYGFVLEGLYRNPGTHAAGVVIGERRLADLIPLTRDKEAEVVTQFTMEPLGEIGLLKMDFLGLKTLTVIQEAVDLVKLRRGIELDIAGLPLDDRPTYELLKRGDTVAVFQLESSGMRDLLRRIGTDRVEDLIALIALYRPGPMNMLAAYVDRKTGKAESRYDHPLLKPILEETYGVMVYQEQVQQAANVLAGYSLGDADILRRAMGKKKADVMEAQRAQFVEGCAKTNGIQAAQAGRIFDTMAEFAGYGFNKAHSAAYGIISYQTAFLKANYPEEFMAATLSGEIGNFDRIPTLIAEVQEMGLTILGPDVNASEPRFKPEDKAIRYGLAGIKNVGEGAAESICRERAAKGPFRDLVDFCGRLDGQSVNRKSLESLVRCGSVDRLGAHRAGLFVGIEYAMARAAEAQRDRQSGQRSLFDLLAEEEMESAAASDLPDCEPWPESQLLAAEKELLGVYLSGHPLSRYAGLLKRYGLTPVTALAAMDARTPVRLGGIAAQIVKRVTKQKQQAMATVQLEDLGGTIEVVVFPEAYARYGAVLTPDAPLLVSGEVSRKEDIPSIVAWEVCPLSEAPRRLAQRAALHVPAAHLDDERLREIRDAVRRHPGATPLSVCLIFPGGEKVFIETGYAFKVCPDDEFVREMERLIGEDCVYVAVAPPAARAGSVRRHSDR